MSAAAQSTFDRRIVERLIAERDAAREEVRALRRMLFADVVPPEEWGLCRQEIMVLQMLMRRELVPMEALVAALWLDPPEAPEQSVFVHICRLRRKIRPHGGGISATRRVGYRLTGKDRLREAMAR
ncbi:helix-turn-helix domain-containing protein [Jiella marina]|uniref:helix-turn-helix domain-containing protein n=1 Tax=Jiella sp. LLJ827 TaxID=2917712 RepID=UPI0021011BAF|nr:helix-turn-helix domain-containing protein [Jiella sp. LLJ827]MCQ0986419.1 helix-turn-helix domain-containing protein [Jiella sp. LLJ827]